MHESTSRRDFLKYTGAAAAAATTVSMAGCLGDDDEIEDVTVTQGTLTDTLDPVGENATPVYNIVDQAYEPFMYRDEDGRPIERIATDWEREDDNTVRLEVREDVEFHSGSELTAEDVAFSINRANNPEVSDVAGVIGAIDEAEADNGDVVVNLNAVVPTIFQNLTAFGRVVEQDWVEERDGDIDTEMNGTGPYELVEFEDGSHVEYERFDDYWGDEPAVESGRFEAREESGARVSSLLAGETDLITNIPPADIADVQEADDADDEWVPSIRSIFLVMNDAHEPFDSVEVRQALNYAVDVEAIIDSILGEFGEPTSQPTLPGHIGHNTDLDPYGHDPEMANQLIEESPYDELDLTLHTPTGRYLRDVDVAASAASDIDELDNVSCEEERRETLELFGEIVLGPDETPADSRPFFLIGWGNPTFDADYTMSPWFRPGAFQHFQDEELQNQLEQADDEPDDDDRVALLEEANEMAREKAPWVFLHQQFSIYGVSDRIDWDAREDEDILFEEMSPA